MTETSDPGPSARAALARRALGLVALAAFVAAPWLGDRSGAACLAYCGGKALESIATSAFAVFGRGDDLERLSASSAVIARESTMTFALVALAGAALVLAPRRRGGVVATAALAGGTAACAHATAWAFPQNAFGLDDADLLVLTGGVVAVPVLVLIACVFPRPRDLARDAWPAFVVAAVTLLAWPGSAARWGVAATTFALALALAVVSTRPLASRRLALAAIVGLAPVALLQLEVSSQRWRAAGAVRALVGLEGQDLRQLAPDDARRLERHRRTLHFPQSPRGMVSPDGSWPLGAGKWRFLLGEPAPWRAARVSHRGADACVLVEGRGLISTPGRAYARVSVFGLDGTLTLETFFGTGWRIDIADASIAPITTRGFTVIDVTYGADLNGRDRALQRYAVAEDRIVLVRLEDSRGRAIRNQYAAENLVVGPHRTMSAADVEAALASGSTLRLLEALMWLGGLHPTRPPRTVNAERWKQADAVRTARASETVKRRLEELLRSDDPWIRDAARLAASPDDGTW